MIFRPQGLNKKILLYVALALMAIGVLLYVFWPREAVSDAALVNPVSVENSQIIANQPVQWTAKVKQIDLTDEKHTIKLPKTATNIKIGNRSDTSELFMPASLAGAFSNITKFFDPRVTQAKEATYFDITKKQNIATAAISNLFSTSVSSNDSSAEITITYTTPAPKLTEKTTQQGKTATISGPEDVEYTNVLAYTNIPEIYDVGQESKIKIQWATENNKQVLFQAFDTNNNGKLDYVEWTVPHLSTQTFNIIYISKAFHLDKNYNIISDIYDTVREKDNSWANVPAGDYVRVTFEKQLTSQNDITIYAKPVNLLNTGSLEVYPVYADANGNLTEGPKLELVPDGIHPDFSQIIQENTYRILLSNLAEPTDVFDLKIVGCPTPNNCGVDIDYIVDPIYTTIHGFNPATDGQNPYGSLLLSGGKLYGMASAGGTSSLGTIFSINPDGTGFSVLYEFAGGGTDGATPRGNLIISGSTLYGMTSAGGDSNIGTVFSIGTDGTGFTLLHEFAGGGTDGATPYGSLILSDATLYGMTYAGGDSNLGTIFSISTSGGSITLLHEFEGSGPGDGAYPYGSLMLSGSTLYGMTYAGGTVAGTVDLGTIFIINTNGTGYSILYQFGSAVNDGIHPYGSLILDGSTLYGMTYAGGTSNAGTVFSISTSGGSITLLHEFAGEANDGGSPYGSLIISESTLYGMTYSGSAFAMGIIFSISTAGTNYTIHHAFEDSSNEGGHPRDSLIQSGSVLYGMTYNGSPSFGTEGTIFSFDVSTSNSAPSFTAGPSDGGSSVSAPTTSGSDVTFTATATDADSDNYYLAVCKTDAITANNSAAPTCATDQTWCVSTSTASSGEATCSYTTSSGDIGSQAWYAFVCDHNAASACSASSQGSGDNGSPFVVSAAPSGEAKFRINGGASKIRIQGGASKLRIFIDAPCGIFVDYRDGKKYDSIQIGDQCWMAENLNVGEKITATSAQTNNATLEKYCYENSDANCDTYGGLYQWNEAMQYASSCNGTGAPPNDVCSTFVQGICPNGWHLPSHYEFNTLERAVCASGSCATDFPYNTTTEGWQGTDEGTKLKTGGSSGFEGILGGNFVPTIPGFQGLADSSHYWTTSQTAGKSWRHNLWTSETRVGRAGYATDYAFSVRCIKNY